MHHCAVPTGNCYVDDRLSTWSFRGYFGLDAFGRLLTLFAALAGLVSSPENRQRLLLIAVSCAVLSLGTALDLTTRFFQPSPNYLALVQTIDALTTLCFAIGIFLALKRGLLFDVVYMVTRGTVYICCFIALLLIVGTIEGWIHWRGSGVAELLHLDQILPGGNFTIDVMISIGCVFGFKRFEDRAADELAVRVLGDEEKSIERLQHFQRQIGVFTKSGALTGKLLNVLRTTARATCVDVFLRDADGAYVAIASSREPKPDSVRAEQLPRRLQGFHETWLRDGGCVPGACIAFPMPVGGRLFGFLACGPKPENIAYTKEEVHEIFGIARETGAALFALGGHA
jgi:hypothetical protein